MTKSADFQIDPFGNNPTPETLDALFQLFWEMSLEATASGLFNNPSDSQDSQVVVDSKAEQQNL